MKNFTTRLVIAIATFLIGITLTFLWLYFQHQKNSKQQSVGTITKQTVSNPSNDLSIISDVLYDFVLVSKDKCGDESIFNHGVQTLPMPLEFEAGYCYVFHRHIDTVNDYLFVDLQNRLRAKGIKIITAEEFAHRNVGGLIFRIEFQTEKYVGVIRNQMDRKIIADKKLNKEWFVDDYILEIKETSISN